MIKANQIAYERLINADPVLVDVKYAHEVFKDNKDFDKYTLLHAGPPIEFKDMCVPMKGAVYCAIMNEGLADRVEDAMELAQSGKLKFKPCHEFQTVGPMTGLTSYSMPLWVVEDFNTKKRAYCNFSEGSGVGLRFGEYGRATLNRLKWISETVAPVFKEALKQFGSIQLSSLMTQGLAMGDELHMRNLACTSLFFKEFAYRVSSVCDKETTTDILKYMSIKNDQFFLNLAMPANKLAADLADGVPGSTLVTAIARNGVEVGIRISALPGRWFTHRAPMVKGLYFPGFTEEDANLDLGDSAIMEVGGFGGCAMATAPAIVKFLGENDTFIANKTTNDMYEITMGEHPKYKIPYYNFRGIPVGIDAMKVVETGITPVLNTAIACNRTGVGMIGAGMSVIPIEPFEKALLALAQELGI